MSRQACHDGGLYAVQAVLGGLAACLGRPFRRSAGGFVALLVAASLFSFPGRAAAEEPAPLELEAPAAAAPCAAGCPPPAPIDYWLINARCITERCPRPGLEGRMRVSHWTGRWEPSTFEAFAADSNPAEVTVFVLHGNLFSHEEAIKFGRNIVQGMRCTGVPLPALRLVIWSWPSERYYLLPEDDFQLKAERSDVQGYLLAGVVAQLPPSTPVRCIGFSYGCRMMFAGFQYLAGGAYRGQTLQLPEPAEGPAGAADFPAEGRSLGGCALAAAFPAEWLAPQGAMGVALTATERVAVFVNHKDVALWRLPRLFDDRDIEAVGVAGVRQLLPSGYRERVVEYDITDEIGRQHRSAPYLQSRRIMALTARHLLEAAPAAQPAAEAPAAPHAPSAVFGPALPPSASAGKSSRRG